MFICLLHFYSSTPTPAYQAIARSLRARDHQVWIGQPDHDGSFVWRDGDNVVERQPGPSPKVPARIGTLPFMLNVRKFLQQVNPDIVQVTPTHWSLILPLAMPHQTRFLLDIRTAGAGSIHRAKSWLNDVSALVTWRIASWWVYDHTAFLDETGAKWLLGEHWSARASIVPLGVGEHFLKFEWNSASEPSAPVQFVYVGTISRIRWLEQIIIAADILRARTHNFGVTLVGPDDAIQSVNYYRRLIEERGLERYVRIASRVTYDQIPAQLSQYDVALNYVPVNRVLRRQTSLKVLECCALGLPQISTRTEPNSESIIDGVNGLLIEDAPEALADAMYRFVNDASWLKQCQQAAQKMRVGITWDQVVDRYLCVYQKMLGHFK